MISKKIIFFIILTFSASSYSDDLFTSSTTVSKSAKNIDVWFTLSEHRDDCLANVYEAEWPGTLLSNASIFHVGSSTAYSAKATIPEYGLGKKKRVIIYCGSEIHSHDIPRPPKIRLWSNLTESEDENLNFIADVYIENQEDHSRCWSNNNPEDFDILNMDTTPYIFLSSDFFSYSLDITGHSDPSVRVAIFCQNTGGITTRGHVWAKPYHNPEWTLYEDVTSYQ